MPAPKDGKKRMSRGVKLAIMGVGGMALLYSCAPAIGGLGGVGGLGALPLLWGMSNPFYRGPVAQNCGPAVPGSPACAPNQSSSSTSSTGSAFRSGSSSSTTTTSSTAGSSSSAQSTSSRGGFGSTASSHGSSGSS